MKTLKDEVGGMSPADIASIVDNPSTLFQNANSLETISVAESIVYMCPSCSNEFETKQLLTRHLLIHTQSGPFPCDYCSEEFEDKYSLRSHWRSCHCGDGCQMCNTCGQSFPTKELLAQHQDFHDRGKRHRCVDCGRAFSSKSDLRKHVMIHTGVRPYVCSICCKSFTRSTNLNKHQKVHSGYRPYSCNQCPKTFSCKGDLGRHQIIHSGIKPFSCSICTLAFTRKDKLTKHEKLHNRGAPLAFTCPVCPAAFTRKEELTKHSQFAHFPTGMDGLLMYVSELVKTNESSKGSASSEGSDTIEESCKNVNEGNSTQTTATGDKLDLPFSTIDYQSISLVHSSDSSQIIAHETENQTDQILTTQIINEEGIKIETHYVDCNNLRVS